jgi:hypothetical protein
MGRLAVITVLFLFSGAPHLLAGRLTLELAASPTALPECSGSEVEISFILENPGTVALGGFEAYLRYPADLFEPVAYVPRDLKGIASANGPSPFGKGYPACDPRPADPWDDRGGIDVVTVKGSAFGPDSKDPLRAPRAVLGAFRFRLREWVDPSHPAEEFGLEFDSCGTVLQATNIVFDPEGNILDMVYKGTTVGVSFQLGIHVENFTCAPVPGGAGVVLTWTLPSDPGLSGVNLYRDGQPIRMNIPSMIQTVIDETGTSGSVYEVAVILKGKEGCRVACSQGGLFIRGDSSGDSKVDLSDSISILKYLFLGGSISCLDAADVDDSAKIDLSDSITLLRFLFLGGSKPPPPFPDSGEDPTADSLGCS